VQPRERPPFLVASEAVMEPLEPGEVVTVQSTGCLLVIELGTALQGNDSGTIRGNGGIENLGNPLGGASRNSLDLVTCFGKEKAIMTPAQKLVEIGEILTNAKQLSRRYKELTGKPLGITGEVAEFEAAQRLGLELAPARSPGYDAKRREAGSEVLIQIKGRCYARSAGDSGQRIGKMDFSDKKKWDAVVLVLMDENFEVREILQASRTQIEARLKNIPLNENDTKTHTQKGALTVSMFRSISKS
jgi:hypothetical protein